MNIKLLLFSLLLLKSCSWDIYEDYTPDPEPYDINPYTPHVGFMFSNFTNENVYVWYEAIYGDSRHEINQQTKVSSHDAFSINIASKLSSIHLMMTENQPRNRLDTLCVYVSDSENGYFNWQYKKFQERSEIANENIVYSIFQYTILNSNIDLILGTNELVPICFEGF